jgi:predicted site-specific integrase-resolvase
LLHDPSEINGGNLNSVRGEAHRDFRNKKRELSERNSENKNIRDLYRGINKFKRGYQPRNNLLKDENGKLLTDSHYILNRWKSYFSQLLNMPNINDIRHIAVRKAETLVRGPNHLEFELLLQGFKSINRQVVTKFQQN